MIKIVTEIDKMRTYSRIMKKQNKLIGFVPTMGAFHEGHRNLMANCRRQCDVAVVSIFVNPTQFGADEDFKKYPRDPVKDGGIARAEGMDILFCPAAEKMYPKDYATYVSVKGLTDTLCGKSRPGHFEGVATVVTKLFEIVMPDIVYFGQKDAQQALVIKKLVEDLNMGITMKIFPIVREETGLAMSSRNAYLNKAERKDALVLRTALVLAEGLITSGEKNSKTIIKKMEDAIKKAPSAKIDYAAIVDAKDLKNVSTIDGEVIVALAVYVGKTRLIDNVIITNTVVTV